MNWEWDAAGRLATVAVWSSGEPEDWTFLHVDEWKAGMERFNPARSHLPIGVEPVTEDEMNLAADVVERAARTVTWTLNLAIGPTIRGTNHAQGLWVQAPSSTIMLSVADKERPLLQTAWHEVYHALYQSIHPDDLVAVRAHGDAVRAMLLGTSTDSDWWQKTTGGGEVEAVAFAQVMSGGRNWPAGIVPPPAVVRTWKGLVP